MSEAAKFAHIADCHLGAFWREKALCELNLQAFDTAIDRCIVEDVAFIIFSGDLFNTSVPEMEYVKRAAAKLQEARQAGIALYFVYGSHDYRQDGHSIADVLATIKFVEDVSLPSELDGRVTLGFTTDPATGVKIAGLSGRRGSAEAEVFAKLDRVALQSEPGTKVFAFHSGVEDIISDDSPGLIPLANFPSGFSYYAGGHCHRHIVKNVRGYGCFAYPGPLFGCDIRDLERTANDGETRGFYIVEIDSSGATKPSFVPVNTADVLSKGVPCDGLTAEKVEENAFAAYAEQDIEGKVLLLKLAGILSPGERIAQVDTTRIRQRLIDKGALSVCISVSGLHPMGVALPILATEGEGISVGEIEDAILRANIIESEARERLSGEAGVDLAARLLAVLRQPRSEEETKESYGRRIIAECLTILGEEVAE